MNNLIFGLIRAILNKIKVSFLKRDTIILGENVVVDYETNIYTKNGTIIYLRDNVYLRSNKRGYHVGMPFNTTLLADVEGAVIDIGKNSRINGAYIHAKKKITIGDNCVVAAGVNIIDQDGHEVRSFNRTIGADEPDEVIIGNNVWICVGAVILKGTKIGDNSIVGANSVVKGVFDENSIIVGNPAYCSKKIDLK